MARPPANLNVEGETVLKAARELAAYPGYVFGLADETFDATVEPFSGVTTDEAGHADDPGHAARHAAPTSLPLTADVNVRVLDTSGRPVERTTDAAGARQRRPRRHQAALRRRRRRERPGRASR